jgi:hypothetical protein
MPGPWDNFFVTKIKEGLEARSLSLSPDEERILTTRVFDLSDESENNAEGFRTLTQKAIGALAEAYARDMTVDDRRVFLQWDDNIRHS